MFDRLRKRRHDARHVGPDDEDEGGGVRELVITLVVAIGIAFLLQQFLVKPYRIPSGSMENTLRCRDRVLVDRISYRFEDPKRGDVVVFHPPAAIGEGGEPDPAFVASVRTGTAEFGDDLDDVEAAKTPYIKRIVGMPGDEIELDGHRAIINGKELDEPYLHPLPDFDGLTDEPDGADEGSADVDPEVARSNGDFGPRTVPKDAYLVLGDNRTHSEDGRYFGWLPRDFIIGRAFNVYWPPKRFGGLPEKDSGRTSQVDEGCIESGLPADAS